MAVAQNQTAGTPPQPVSVARNDAAENSKACEDNDVESFTDIPLQRSHVSEALRVLEDEDGEVAAAKLADAEIKTNVTQ